jgi:hypothetical protein
MDQFKGGRPVGYGVRKQFLVGGRQFNVELYRREESDMHDTGQDGSNKKTKWLVYTVLIGLIPVLIRFTIWLVTTGAVIELFSAFDFVAFGLVLHISNINEIEHITHMKPSWKTAQNGIAILFIVAYSTLFALTLLGESVPNLVNSESVTYGCISLSVVSFIISFSVLHCLYNSPGVRSDAR